MRLCKLFLSFGIILSIALAFAALPSHRVYAGAFSGSKQAACEGVKGTTNGACDAGNAAGAEQTANGIIKAVINIISIIAGIAAVIMVIIAGIKFITSRGDSSSIASARSALLYALVGLVVVAMAQVIVRFVLGRSLA